MKKDPYFRSYQMETINNVLDRFLSFGGIDSRIHDFESVIAFNQLSETERYGCAAVNIKEGKLFVEAPNNSAANLLSLKKDAIIKKINENVRRDNVKDIIFSLNMR